MDCWAYRDHDPCRRVSSSPVGKGIPPHTFEYADVLPHRTNTSSAMITTLRINARTSTQPHHRRLPPLQRRDSDSMSANWTTCKYASSSAPVRNRKVPAGSAGRNAVAELDPSRRSTAACTTEPRPSPTYVVCTSMVSRGNPRTRSAEPVRTIFQCKVTFPIAITLGRRYVEIRLDLGLLRRSFHLGTQQGNRSRACELFRREGTQQHREYFAALASSQYPQSTLQFHRDLHN